MSSSTATDRPSAKTSGALPPMLSGGLPVLGHTIEFGRGPIELLTRARHEHGDVCAFRVAGKVFTFLSGPEANEAMFRASDDVVSFREPYRLTVPIFGKGVVYDAEPAVMGEQLGFLMNSLRDKRMRTYAEKVADEVDRFVADWGDEGERDLVETTKELTTYTSSRCLLGKEFRENMTKEFAEVYHDLEAGLIPIGYLSPNLPLPAFRRRDRARRRMVVMIEDIIDYRRKKNVESEDFVQTLMEARYSDGRALTADEITGILLAAIFAGHHTSSLLSAWTCIEILRAPRFLPPILDEIERVYGQGQPVTYASLRELVNLENAVKEAGRLNPPLVILLRKLVKDLEFNGYRIPEGSFLVSSPYVSHRIPDVFKDPHVFDPDRFGPEREEDRKNPYALITFGGGRHKCLGMHFAHMQIKALWSVLFRLYDFELLEAKYESDFTRMVVGPKQPCRIRYRRRVARRSAA